MAPNPFAQLDWKRWFDRMLPQTLQIALWLLYIEGAFAFLDWLDGANGIYGLSRMIGGPGGIVAPLGVVAHVLGGLLIANGRRVGWYAGLFASFTPFVLRALIALRLGGLGPSWVVTQDNLVGFVFEAALVALLVHPQSRGYARAWLR